MPVLYNIKKMIMYPRTVYMRRKEAHLTGFIKAALELHYYRPSFYKFMQATMLNTGILHDVDVDKRSVVFDVGAYVGDWSNKMYEKYACRIHAFEPNPNTYSTLVAAAQGRWLCHEYGVAGATEELSLSLNGMGSSVFALGNLDKKPQYTNVRLRAIDEVWDELGVDTIDLMKINIEGGEYPLLERMIEKNMQPDVRLFLIQFHEWLPGAYYRRWKIRSKLRKTHRLKWDYHFVWECWERKG